MLPSNLFRLGWQYHVYKVDASGGQLEDIEEETGDSYSVHAARNWILPSADFEGLWESLVFDAGVKERESSALRNMVPWNQ